MPLLLSLLLSACAEKEIPSVDRNTDRTEETGASNSGTLKGIPN